MPDLQSCYFCGTPENVQEYAVVPPRFIPDGDEPQSAVLCDRCKTKLLEVVQPLTEQLDDGSASEPSTAESAATEPTASDDASAPGDPGGTGITMSSGGEDGADAAPATDSETASPEPASKPPHYRRAMRMLSNREFPLARSEVESMLAGAYDLERHEVDAALKHAVAEGRLREEDGEFYQS